MNPDVNAHVMGAPLHARWKASLGGCGCGCGPVRTPCGIEHPCWDTSHSSDGTEGVYAGKSVILMCMDDCLGMASHPVVREAAVRAIERYGTGCAGSRFLNGTLDIHEELEHRLAHLLKREAAVLFPSGYQANMGTVSALVTKNDVAVVDAGCAPAVIDGGRLAMGRVRMHREQDACDLNRTLEQVRGRNALVVVDGVMQPAGTRADLPSIWGSCRMYGAGLMVNDAYGIGVNGSGGAGTARSFGLERDVDLITGSLGKALGAAGGFAAGDTIVIEYLKHHARSLIFSASLAPSSAAAALAALDVLVQEPERRAGLAANTAYFAAVLREMGFRCGNGEGAAVPVYFEHERQCQVAWRRLLEAGVLAVRWPGAACRKAGGIIKVCITSNHTRTQLNRVLDVFSDKLPR